MERGIANDKSVCELRLPAINVASGRVASEDVCEVATFVTGKKGAGLWSYTP